MKIELSNITRRVFAGALAAVGISGLSTVSAMAEDTIRAVSGFPKPLAFTQSYLGFIEEVNKRGKGVVQINFAGGPEIMPMKQQMDAVRRGVLDMHYGPASVHLGTMSEADAWVGSNVTAAEGRENGGFKLMEEAFSEKLGVKLLAHIDSGIKFHVYTTSEPQRTEEGGVDLSGMRLRSQPIYQSFFESMGAVPVSIGVPDVYTGLERNTFDGAGWPIVAIQDLSWDKFLKYRVDPGFFSTDLAVVISPKKWDALSEESRKLLTEVAIEYEKTSYDNFQQLISKIDGEVQADGMTIVKLEGDAADKYLSNAHESAWSRMEKAGTPRYEALRAAYYKE